MDGDGGWGMGWGGTDACVRPSDGQAGRRPSSEGTGNTGTDVDTTFAQQ